MRIFCLVSQAEGALTGVHFDGQLNNRGSEPQSHKQHSLCLTVPALRGVCYWKSWPIRGFCLLNLHCSVSAEKNPIIVAPTCYHRLLGLCLEVSHVLVGNRKQYFHHTILTTYNNEGLCFLRLPLGVSFLVLRRSAFFCTLLWGGSFISG